MKYKVVFDPERHKETSKFLYKENETLLDWVANDTDLGIQIGAAAHQKSLEADIADWSDTIAYSVNDVEDNIRAGLFDLVRMSKKIAEIHEIAQKRDPTLTEKDVEALAVQMGKALLFDPQTERDRKIALKRWSSATITDLMSDTSIKEADGKKVSPRYAFQLQRGDAAVRKTAILKAAASVLVFGNPSVSTLEYKGVTILGKLFEYLIDDPKLLPYDFRELIRENGDQTRRLVADFISGMTDTYAQNYYSRLTTPGVGSFYEHI
jgi:dGTPase